MNIGMNANGEKDEIIINGRRYVPEESSRYLEATVAGTMGFELKEMDLSAQALVITDVDGARFNYGVLPVGARIRITFVSSKGTG